MDCIFEMYDLSHTMASDYLSGFTYPWEALSGIQDMILALGERLEDGYEQVSKNVWVHKTAKVAPSASLGAPCIIGAGTQIRHGAFVRGSALVGENCVVGNSVELKNVILFDSVQTPHYNYVGDSILGYKAHMGAGAITSNVKSDKSLVTIHSDSPVPTGIKKVGAMLGLGGSLDIFAHALKHFFYFALRRHSCYSLNRSKASFISIFFSCFKSTINYCF